MKTIKYTLAKFMVAAIVAVVLVGCKKENEPQNNNNGNPTEVAQQQNGDAVERIVNFKKQLAYYKANPGIKDGEKVSLEDAVWNIENTFDATYAFPEDAYAETRTQEFTLHLDVDADGNVLLTDLTAFYDQMVVDARTAYANDGFTDKIFISLMAEAFETRGDGVDVKITMTSGERTNVNQNHDSVMVHYLTPFNNTENWNYRYDLGRCGTGEDAGIGADTKLQDILSLLARSKFEEASEGYRNIYVNRQTLNFDGRSYPGVFYRTDVNETCIQWLELNALFHSEKRLIFEQIPQGDSSLGNVLGITIVGELVYVDMEPSYITHHNEIEYAQRCTASIEEIGEPKDLLEQ